MDVLSRIAQPNMSRFVGGGDGQHHQNNMMHQNGSSRSGNNGFTLLQGHIQLMAMVPNLPENLTSPRWKGDGSSRPASQQQLCDDAYSSALPMITPRMMPSASKYKRPFLSSILAGKASQGSGYPSYGSSCWQTPRSLSNLSLPPRNSQPITMPSFARCLPGTKRAIVQGTSTSTGALFPNGDVCNNAPNNSCFPIIPTQARYQHPNSTVEMIRTETQQQQQMGQIFAQQQQVAGISTQNPTMVNVDPYSTAWSPPSMAYQMVNVANPHPQEQQQQFEYSVGSGDHSMASVIHQIQQQQNVLAYPYHQYPQQVLAANDIFHYSQQAAPPYAVQSLPCFGTPCTSTNLNTNYTLHNYPVSTGVSSKTGFVLSPISSPTNVTESPQPVYSASMPEICLGAVPQTTGLHHPSSSSHQHHHHHHRDQAALHLRSNKKGGKNSNPKFASTPSNGKNEVAIILEGSSSSSSSMSFSSEDEDIVGDREAKAKISGRSKGCKSVSVLKLREIQKQKRAKKAKEEARYAALGPESNPDKIPSHPRVAHTPVLIPPKKEEEEGKQDQENSKNDTEKCTKAECRCTHCKCCNNKKNNIIPNNNADTKPEQQQHDSLEDKVKEMRSKLTPRRKGKPVVVAVHDCFPSDSSVSEVESDLDSARKSCFNYTGSNGAMVRKRKPTINAILKNRLKGDSSDVFDDLDNDLNPDEARTYTCDYLVELLTSDDWNNCYTALQIIIRLARHRPKVLLNYLTGPILWCTFRHITSPKSALCRAAIVTFKELFQKIGSALDNDLEKITEKLVLKSLAPNMFIREECDRALEAMVAHCNLVKVLNAMDIVSKRPHARAAGHRLSRMALQIVQVAGVDLCLKPLYAEKLLPMLFGFMTEANNGTRTAAKEALGMLMNHLQFEAAVTRHVTFDRNCTEVFKKLDKMRGRTRNRRQMMGNSRYPLPHAHFRR